jgi:hypothetical protein
LPDPKNEPLERVRKIRDDISQRVNQLVVELDQEDLAAFGDEKPAEEIRACADAVLAGFADVPVRSFVLTLAHRRARECLPDGSCAELVASVHGAP